MGLQQVTYTLDAAPDWAALETALRASMGVRVSVRATGDVASVQAGGIGGGAHLRCAGGVYVVLIFDRFARVVVRLVIVLVRSRDLLDSRLLPRLPRGLFNLGILGRLVVP